MLDRVGKENSPTLLWELYSSHKLVQPLWKMVWRFLQKKKKEKKEETCHMIQQSHSWAYIWTKL